MTGKWQNCLADKLFPYLVSKNKTKQYINNNKNSKTEEKRI